jgi:hypothetical protein
MVKVITLNGSEYLFISTNVPSLKNSKVKTSKGIFSSKTVGKYLRGLGIQSYSSSKKIVKGYVNRPNEFLKCQEYFEKYLINKPYEIGFHFVRGTKHKFDFNNATQIIADLMTAHNFIEDDDMDNFIPFPFKINNQFYTYNKENPGVYIKILN